VPSLLELTTAWTTEALERSERTGDPVLKFWGAQWRAESAARWATSRDGPLHHHPRRNGEQLDQPIFAWGHAFVRSLRAQIAGDVDLAEQCASEALQIGTTAASPTPPLSLARSS